MTTINAKLDGEDFIIIDGVLHSILERRGFDDFGVTLDSYKVVNYQGDTKGIQRAYKGNTRKFKGSATGERGLQRKYKWDTK